MRFQLVAADGTMHAVSRTRTADAGVRGWLEHILQPGEQFDAVVTLDAFYTDVETGDRGPELAIPVKPRPDAVAADKTDAGTR